ADAHRLRPREAPLAAHQFDPGVVEPTLAAAAERRDDLAGPLTHGSHVDRRRTDVHAIVAGAAHDVRDPPGGDHRLRGRAPLVDAGTADVLALDEGDAPPRLREGARERATGLAGSD